MRITGFHTTLVNLPLERPIATAIHQIQSVGCVLLELETDQGLTGESYVFTLNGVRLSALSEMVNSFSHQVVGQDPHHSAGIQEAIWGECNAIGHKGFPIAAIAAVDVACWDLVGKAANKPLHQLFGACRNSVPTYASGGLWLSQSIDDCQRDAQSFLDAGFRAMKIRLGSRELEKDVRRVRAVREVIGDEVVLLADANQGLQPKQAIRLGRLLEPFNLGWFEEPVSYMDLDGHHAVRTALTIPVASGETEYTRFGMRALLEAKAADVLMPDLQRVGGYGEMRRSAAIASVYQIPISTHVFTEHSIAIGATEPHCLSVEHMPWFAQLFNESMSIVDGDIQLPPGAGTGFTFNQDVVRRFRIS